MSETLQLQKYGVENLGRLKRVLLHKPVQSIRDMTAITAGYYLFDNVPDVEQFLLEHEQYKSLLQSFGVEVLELSDYVREHTDKMNILSSLTYLHDVAVISRRGAILSKMGYGRAGEDAVVKEALLNLGIPIFHEFATFDHFEGCLLLSPKTIFIAHTERHRLASIQKLITKALALFDEVIYVDVPKSRRFMHADMIYNRISDNLSLAYLPAFLQTYLITQKSSREIDFMSFMKARGIELVNLSDREQRNWGCSIVPLEPNIFFHYDFSLSAQTKKYLYSKGVKIIEFHPNALLAGGGSLRCLTLRLLRETES
jgi:arginine deiminase